MIDEKFVDLKIDVEKLKNNITFLDNRINEICCKLKMLDECVSKVTNKLTALTVQVSIIAAAFSVLITSIINIFIK